MTVPQAPGSASFGAGPAGPPSVRPIDRLRRAYQQRHDSDYIFSFWTALGWTILTFGVFYFYVFYQLMRRMRAHILRRLELLEAARDYAWEVAAGRGLQDELRPNFERAATYLGELRRLTTEFRDPGIWLLLSIVGGRLGIVEIIAYVFLDGDLIKHDTAEGGAEAELATIYARLGQPVPQPDPTRIKGKHNYIARIIVSIVTLGIYAFWWTYNIMDEPNRNFETNWAWEDSLAQAAQGLLQA